MLFTGPGWGKSASAFGYTLRAAGRGWPVTVVQFIKGRSWNEAEASIAMMNGVHWPVLTPGLTWGGRDPQDLCAQAWSEAQEALSAESGGLVILDEITRALDHGWLDPCAVATAICERQPATSVIMTGQSETPELIHAADHVVRFDLTKHDESLGKPMAQ